ncbi:MAG: DUF4160 domain-containing protein [Bacteroidia bacterium]|nr:DUF4160 domain-containing protein [Bacteroidia bacterium]
MPTVLRIGPYKFFFFSAEGREPPHIHVGYEKYLCKIWLETLKIAEDGGLPAHRLNQILRYTKDNQQMLLDAYRTYHSN